MFFLHVVLITLLSTTSLMSAGTDVSLAVTRAAISADSFRDNLKFLTPHDLVYVNEIGALIDAGDTESMDTACEKIEALCKEYNGEKEMRGETPTVENHISVISILVLLHGGKDFSLDYQLEALVGAMMRSISGTLEHQVEGLPVFFNDLCMCTLVRMPKLGAWFVEELLQDSSLSGHEKFAPWAWNFAKNYVSYIRSVEDFNSKNPLVCISGWLMNWKESIKGAIEIIPHTLSIDGVRDILHQSRELLEFSHDELLRKLCITYFMATKDLIYKNMEDSNTNTLLARDIATLSKEELDVRLEEEESRREIEREYASPETVLCSLQKEFVKFVGQVANTLAAHLPNMTKISPEDQVALLAELEDVLKACS